MMSSWKGCSLSALLATLFCFNTADAAVLKSFADETRAIADTIKCPNPKITRTQGLPDLWGCIFPGAEVVKVFVNANDGNASIRNVKIMWNDWTRDAGYGVHAERAIAEAWVTALAIRYAPERVQEIMDAFRGKTNAVIQSSRVNLKYTYLKGPSIDERLITVTPLN